MNALCQFRTPQLRLVHRGKVRDSFRIDASTRLIVATDRLSAFDQVLETQIPGKGAALTRMAAWAFDAARDVFPNHMIRRVGEQGMLVREAEPVRLEFVVRAYLAGSAWRAYARGERTVSGVRLPDGLAKNAHLPEPVVTPTTKSDHDEAIAARDIVQQGLLSRREVAELERASLSRLPLRRGDARAARDPARRHEVRVRPHRRGVRPDRRDPHAGLVEVLASRELRARSGVGRGVGQGVRSRVAARRGGAGTTSIVSAGRGRRRDGATIREDVGS